MKFFWNYQEYSGWVDDNFDTYEYFDSHLENCWEYIILDVDHESIRSTDHMKLVIIDGEIVYVGSHNWNESSLFFNHETSLKIVSRDVAKIFTDYFYKIIKG